MNGTDQTELQRPREPRPGTEGHQARDPEVAILQESRYDQELKFFAAAAFEETISV